MTGKPVLPQETIEHETARKALQLTVSIVNHELTDLCRNVEVRRQPADSCMAGIIYDG